MSILIKQYESEDKKVYETLTPYNSFFTAKAKKLGGKWNASLGRWSFSGNVKDHVKQAIFYVYGFKFGEKTSYVTVRIRVSDTSSISCGYGPIEIAGRSIARAFGRDSGAKSGDDVAVIEGEALSGGSVKNWATIITKGAIIEIYNVPLAAAKRELAEPSYSNTEISIIFPPEESEELPANAASKIPLLEEKEKLLARLAKIEAELEAR